MSTLVFIVVALIIAFLIFAATRPNTFHVERSTSIAATPAKVFNLINDFNAWDTWSPWAGKDPNMDKTVSEPSAGPGAFYEWDGNKKVGKGRMEIIDSSTNRVSLKLDFLKPFEAHNQATFNLAPEGENTRVTWALDGPQPFMTKLISVFASMDRMVGKDFEAGLATLKQIAED